MLPVLSREVVEAEQGVAILDQALDRLVVFDAPRLDEGVEGGKRIRLGLGHPDFLQCPLGFRLLAVRQFVEDVGGFVHPAALPAGVGPHLFDGLPKSKRAIGDRQLRANRQPTPLQIEEQFPPRLRTFAYTVAEADKLLPALGCGSDNDQQALRAVFETGLHVNAVGPEVDVAFGREIALAPARVLLRPGLLEASNGRGREPAGVPAEQCDQRFLEVAGRDALEVEDRDQHLQARSSAPRNFAPFLPSCRAYRLARLRQSSTLLALPLRRAASGMRRRLAAFVTAWHRGNRAFELLRLRAAAAQARGVTLGNPRLAEARDKANAAGVAAADAFAANVRPIIRENSGERRELAAGIARALTARGVPTARGGRWTAAQGGATVY